MVVGPVQGAEGGESLQSGAIRVELEKAKEGRGGASQAGDDCMHDAAGRQWRERLHPSSTYHRKPPAGTAPRVEVERPGRGSRVAGPGSMTAQVSRRIPPWPDLRDAKGERGGMVRSRTSHSTGNLSYERI